MGTSSKDCETIDRLLAEIRQQDKVIQEIKRELFSYGDLNRLSVKGAISYLIRHKRLLDDVKSSADSVSKDPDEVLSTLKKIQLLLERVDD